MSTADHPEYKALLRAICANPDDDTPRLVMADWLDEHGEADRAEFIRLQCALARGEFKDDYSKLYARHREDKLFRILWQEPLQELGARNVKFERGFANYVKISIENLQKNSEALMTLAPITSLTVFGDSGRMSDKDATTLAHLPALRNLKKLNLSGNRIGDDGVAAIAGSKYLGNLDSLELSDNAIEDGGAMFLLRSMQVGNLSRLTDITLGHNLIFDDEIFDEMGEALKKNRQRSAGRNV